MVSVRFARYAKMCGMRFQHTTTYDAPAAEVFAMLTDPAWREKVGAAQNVVSSTVTVTPDGPDGAGCRVVIDQVQNTAGLPAIAKKIAATPPVRSSPRSGRPPTTGTIEILAPGKPTKATGTVSLVSDGSSTRHVTDLEVTVKVPLVGGKLEKLMADNIGQGLEIEQTVGAAWLEGDRTRHEAWRPGCVHELTYEAPLADVAAMLADPRSAARSARTSARPSTRSRSTASRATR